MYICFLFLPSREVVFDLRLLNQAIIRLNSLFFLPSPRLLLGSRGIVRMIARILAALGDSMEIPAESVLGTIKIAVMPIAKVFTMCFLGLLMASKYVNILTPSGRKLLNGVGKSFMTFFSFDVGFLNSVSFSTLVCPLHSYSWSSRFCFPA